MKRSIFKCGVLVGLVAVVGCAEEKPNTFKLVGELPPDFAYEAVALYEPEPGTKCEVAEWSSTMPSFHRPWPKEYNPTSIIEIRKTIKDCRMIVRHIRIRIMATYRGSFFQEAEDRADIGIYPELDDKYKRVLNAEDGDTFYGECQWLFYTKGPNRVLANLLLCKKVNERGELSAGNPFAAYLVDQLPGKTIRMNIRLADEERPFMKMEWEKFPNGWKRCSGDGPQDVDGFCDDNSGKFGNFKMPDGRICNIYPGCEVAN